MTKVVAYLRVSTSKQEDGTSIAGQRERIRMYAQLHDLDVVEWVEDVAASAKSLARPGLRRALDALESGDAEGVIVNRLDRLTRSVRDLGVLLEHYFQRHALLSVGEQVDTRTATGRMVLNVITSIAQWEREQVAERVEHMHAVKRRKGERVGAPPFGYAVAEDGRTLVEDRDEQRTLARIRALRGEGASYQRIASMLNAEGAIARGSRWHPTTVARIVRRAS